MALGLNIEHYTSLHEQPNDDGIGDAYADISSWNVSIHFKDKLVHMRPGYQSVGPYIPIRI